MLVDYVASYRIGHKNLVASSDIIVTSILEFCYYNKYAV